MNADINLSRNPSPLTMPLVGCCILGGYMLAHGIRGIDLRLDWAFHTTLGVSPMRNITLLPVT